MRSIRWLLCALSLSCAAIAPSSGACAELVVGQAIPALDPPFLGQQLQAGIELCFEVTNKNGGVQGNTLRLVTVDRGIDASKSVEIVRGLINREHPVALVGMMGTASMAALLKERVIEQAGIPVIGIRSGAQALRTPFNPWLFHTRADYANESVRIVNHLTSMGYRRVAIFNEDSDFGREALGQLTHALAGTALVQVATASYDTHSPDVSRAVAAIAAARPDIVIAAGESEHVADFYKDIQVATGRTPLIALSTVDAILVVKRIGADRARGLGVVLVVPDAASSRFGAQRDFQEAARRYGGPHLALSQATFEGYLSARVLVAALKRAGPNPTREKLRDALDQLHSLDLGGLIYSFSPINHAGSNFFDIGIVGRDGRVMR